MTVQELIDELMKVDDKSKIVLFEDMVGFDVCEFEKIILLENDGIMED